MILDPSSKETIVDDERYRELLRGLMGSLYEGLAYLMTETVGVNDDLYAGGLLQKVYELNQDVWNLVDLIEDRKPVE